MIKYFSLLVLLVSQALYGQKADTTLAWPEITSVNKPWTRWYWPGSIVTPSGLTTAMEKYHKAGLGGLEITVIYGVKGQEDKFINYLSPKWMDMFTHTLKEARRLNMGIDLANATGWPFGGPWVDPADACKNINYKTWSLKSGEALTEPVSFVQKPLLTVVGQNPGIKNLVDPVSKNKDLYRYALNQVRFEKPLPLQILMAYSGDGQTLNLTDKVDINGKLNWTAPSGNWTLYALFEGWHGKQVERAGPGGEGDVIDHFSGQAIDNYLKHFDDVFKNHDIKSLRGYFNDSYEVDDAIGQANWTDKMFDEFKSRRGYDLSKNLPALFQRDESDKNARVLSDYRQTIADLILEKYTTHWTAWAHQQGKITRHQAHGSPGNILDLYAAADIPEMEGRLKFASSAANVTGKKYASCEAATWLGEHFSSTLSDVRKAIDNFFLLGVNHVFYQGTCFTPQNEPWPGWLFYASTEFSPANSFWNDFPALNNYIAHVQSFLQSGKSDNDILLYFPIFDRYADFGSGVFDIYGKGMLEHFDGLSRAYNGTPFKTGYETMIEKGYAFDLISDLQIKNTRVDKGLLQTEGNKYKTLILPGCKYIPLETFSQILKLANDGANIIFYGNLPENISGWADLETKNKTFLQLKESLSLKATDDKNILRAGIGKGKIIMGDDITKLLAYADIRRETMTDNGIKFTRRERNTGNCYFILNQTNKPFEGWLPIQVKASSAGIFNPMTEKYGIAEKRITANGSFEIYSRMLPGESLIIETFNNKVSDKPYHFYDPVSPSEEITGKWTFDFIEGGPALPASKEVNRLISWTEFGGDAVKDFSGTAKYTINFNKPSGNVDAWAINLGKVCESARVILNGNELGILIGPDYQVIIEKNQLKAKNTLEIKVSNLMGNRIAYLDRNKVEWKKFYDINFASKKYGVFDASSWQSRESGLIGPVTLTAMKLH